MCCWNGWRSRCVLFAFVEVEPQQHNTQGICMRYTTHTTGTDFPHTHLLYTVLHMQGCVCSPHASLEPGTTRAVAKCRPARVMLHHTSTETRSTTMMMAAGTTPWFMLHAHTPTATFTLLFHTYIHHPPPRGALSQADLQCPLAPPPSLHCNVRAYDGPSSRSHHCKLVGARHDDPHNDTKQAQGAAKDLHH